MQAFKRRTFLLIASSAAAAVAGRVAAQTGGKVSESDPQAVALGYKDDTTKVDNKKYPKHTPDQKCANCQFFQGKATDALGPCAVFGNRNVSAKGWCSSWTKKAA